MENGRYPILLFLLGGSFFNLFLGVTLLVLSSLLYDSPFLSPIFYCLAIICLLYALLIAIPMTERNGGRNSGLLALELSRDQTSLPTRYALAVLYSGDAVQAQAILNEFNNSRMDSLFPTAVQESRDFLMLVDRIAAERVQQSLA